MEEGRGFPNLIEVILTRTVSPDDIVIVTELGESVDASMLISTDFMSDFLDFAVNLIFLTFWAGGNMDAAYSDEK